MIVKAEMSIFRYAQPWSSKRYAGQKRFLRPIFFLMAVVCSQALQGAGGRAPQRVVARSQCGLRIVQRRFRPECATEDARGIHRRILSPLYQREIFFHDLLHCRGGQLCLARMEAGHPHPPPTSPSSTPMATQRLTSARSTTCRSQSSPTWHGDRRTRAGVSSSRRVRRSDST